LFDPRLLPIGVEIVIPDRATGVPITAPPRQTETASAAKVTDDDGLEPIPHFALPGKSRLQDGT
jgi:hypothetical protein